MQRQPHLQSHRVLIISTDPTQYYGVEARFWWWLLPKLLALSGLLVATDSLAGLI